VAKTDKKTKKLVGKGIDKIGNLCSIMGKSGKKWEKEVTHD
jgi:hypothetical protein